MSDPNTSSGSRQGRRPTTTTDPAIEKWISEQRIKSVDNLESAAQQIITLSTTLLGVIFTLAAIESGTISAQLKLQPQKGMAIATLILFFLSLTASIVVVWPYKLVFPDREPGAKERAFKKILTRKESALRFSAFFFIIGLVTLAIITVRLLGS